MIPADTIIEFVNNAVREEHGMPMKELTDKLVDTGIDSFGIVMVMLEISKEYDVYGQLQNENVVNLTLQLQDEDTACITLGDIIKRVQDESSK